MNNPATTPTKDLRTELVKRLNTLRQCAEYSQRGHANNMYAEGMKITEELVKRAGGVL